MMRPNYYKTSFDYIVPFFYDPVLNLSLLGTAKRKRMKLIDNLPRNSRKIIDFATGTGDLAILAKQRFPKAEIYGIDLSPGMLDKARRKAEKRKIDIKFENSNIEKTRFKDSEFDAAMFGFCFHEVPAFARKNGIKEAARLLKKDATLAILDFHKPRNKVMLFLFSIYLRMVEPNYRQAKAFLDYDLAKLVKDSGFDILKHKRIYSDTIQMIIAKKK